MPTLLQQTFYHNSARQWGIALGTAIATLLILLLVRRILVDRLDTTARRTATGIDDAVLALARRTRVYFLSAAAVLVGARFLALPPTAESYLATAFILVALAQLGVWGTTGVNLWIQRQIERHRARADAASVSTMRALGIAAKVVLWTIVAITVLDQLGVNITALVTGLGIGGVALALAVQNILGDLLAALSIVFDKPFDVGDFIVVDEVQGTVEHIGLKTTRLRSISGEQVIVSNGDLLRSRIRNFKRMLERRVVFTTDVAHDTPPEVVAKIPATIREVVTTQQPVRFDRSHFSTYTDSALRIETVYYVLDPDYTRFLDIQQTINLELLRRFNADKIRLAFPGLGRLTRVP
jgi:small-conductance mechanosensitive channel